MEAKSFKKLSNSGGSQISSQRGGCWKNASNLTPKEAQEIELPDPKGQKKEDLAHAACRPTGQHGLAWAHMAAQAQVARCIIFFFLLLFTGSEVGFP